MSSAQAILAGCILIAAAILFVNTIGPATAQAGGPWQLMHHSNINANAGVFRLDTATGEVSYCYVTGDAALVCSRAVR
jgi:hypothetical protein